MDDLFPLLRSEGFTPTSVATAAYNCIAWAAGATDAWWWPDPAFTHHWPLDVPRTATLSAFFAAFALLGYEPADHGELEQGHEKVAFYALNGAPQHAARQLPDGTWTSKLGPNIDIAHTLRGLEGPAYGQVAGFMRRALVSAQQTCPSGIA